MMRTLVPILCLIRLLGPAAAQEQHAQGAVYSRVEGAELRLVVDIDIDHGWHLYHGPTRDDLGPPDAIGSPTTLSLPNDGVSWSAPRFPEPERLEQDLVDFKTHIFAHRGSMRIYARGRIVDTKFDAAKLAVTIKGLTCQDGDSGLCVPYNESLVTRGPGTEAEFAAFPADLDAPGSRTGSASAASDGSALQTSSSEDEGLVDALAVEPEAESTVSATTATVSPGTVAIDDGDASGAGQSLLQFLLLAVTWGFVTLLMPCTYPMIPITISFFTKQAASRSGRVLPLSLCYGAGIVLIFVVIGVAVGPVIIPFATHPITNVVIGGFFLFFALALFGAIELRPPAFLMNAAGRASRQGGYVGVFAMGATLVVTSFTCTAPFVGSLLSFGAAGGELWRIALGMSVFGLTMAIPFVLLSLLPGRLHAIPRSGEWMHALKVFLGFVEVAAALKFLSNADLVWQWNWLSRELFLVLWAGIFLVAAAYVLGLIRLHEDTSSQVSPMRLTGGVCVFLFSIYCAYGAQGHRLDPIMTAIIPPYSGRIGVMESNAEIQDTGPVIITDDYDAALKLARKDDKLLMVNFTGITCVNCRLMEERVFPVPVVADELRNMVEARLHTDGSKNIERIKELQKQLTGSVANPIYVIVDPKTGKKLRLRAGFTPAEKFAAFLRG